MPDCLIALGSNLGDRQATLDRAVDLLQQKPDVTVCNVSRWHSTAPVGGPSDQAEFLNGAVRIETQLAPLSLFAELQQIEIDLGRQREIRWAPRSVDLDLLLYNSRVVAESNLIVPHPRMAFRRFVLEPAAEIAADMVHPSTGWTVQRLLEHLNAARDFVAIAGVDQGVNSAVAAGVAECLDIRCIAEPDQKDDFSGDALEQEIESLRQRARLLDATEWPPDSPVISDFWFDQTLAQAELRLSGELLETFRDEFDRLRQIAVPPKLLVILDSASCQAASLQSLLDALASRRDQGPVLRLAGDDVAGAITEVSAAITAMRRRTS